MNTSTRHTLGLVFGRWLVTLQVERVERATTFTPADDESFIDWDALAEQYGVPVSANGDGLQMCAECGQSVALDSSRFVYRIALEDFAARVAHGYPHPAGGYLCLACEFAMLNGSRTKSSEVEREAHTRRSTP